MKPEVSGYRTPEGQTVWTLKTFGPRGAFTVRLFDSADDAYAALRVEEES